MTFTLRHEVHHSVVVINVTQPNLSGQSFCNVTRSLIRGQPLITNNVTQSIVSGQSFCNVTQPSQQWSAIVVTSSI